MTSARLSELAAIRDRSLTDDEQREVLYLAKRERERARYRARYHSDPEYRQRRLRAERQRRGFTRTRADWASVRPRNEAGRFV